MLSVFLTTRSIVGSDDVIKVLTLRTANLHRHWNHRPQNRTSDRYRLRLHRTCVRALVFECCSFDENVLELVSNVVILEVFEGYDQNVSDVSVYGVA